MTNPFADPTETLVLCIMDGFGIAPASESNAVLEAKTPFFNLMFSKYPTSELEASGPEVGLPPKQMGNSEVGHMTMGGGRVISQDLERINESISTHMLVSDPEIILLSDRTKLYGGKCHLIGMMSDGCVHGSLTHVLKLALMLGARGVEVSLHLIADGRDVDPKSAPNFLQEVLHKISKYQSLIKIASICGRYYAMDRDNRWDRTSIAYEAIVAGTGKKTANFMEEINRSYDNKITDEFFLPLVNNHYTGMKKGDSLLITNFRSDRINQLATALTAGADFNRFSRSKVVTLLNKLSITSLSNELNKVFRVIFKPRVYTNIFGEILYKNAMRQLRVAETEKFPHVTYFFNVGREEPFPEEERILIPSPSVVTYDLKPEMSAALVAKQVVSAINSKKYKFILCNFANADMVGHTGNMAATVKAVEEVDRCVAEIANAVTNRPNTVLVVTSDHGNCEEMHDETTGNSKTSHTLNPVPFVLVGAKITKFNVTLKNGSLKDVAPTLLQILRLPIPFEMSGSSLIVNE